MDKLKDKVSVITGAGSGMGKAMAFTFASEGSKSNCRWYQPIQARSIKKAGTSHLTTILANMAIESDIQRLIDEAVRIYGTLDILVNNAGIMDHFAPVGDLDDEMWESIEDQSRWPYESDACSHQGLPAKEAQSHHQYIIYRRHLGHVQVQHILASKHGLIGLTKNTGYIYTLLQVSGAMPHCAGRSQYQYQWYHRQ